MSDPIGDLFKYLLLALCCVPFAIWKWIDIIIWLVKHVSIAVK